MSISRRGLFRRLLQAPAVAAAAPALVEAQPVHEPQLSGRLDPTLRVYAICTEAAPPTDDDWDDDGIGSIYRK